MKVQELINLLQKANKPDKDIFVADSTALLEPFVMIETDKIIIDAKTNIVDISKYDGFIDVLNNNIEKINWSKLNC